MQRGDIQLRINTTFVFNLFYFYIGKLSCIEQVSSVFAPCRLCCQLLKYPLSSIAWMFLCLWTSCWRCVMWMYLCLWFFFVEACCVAPIDIQTWSSSSFHTCSCSLLSNFVNCHFGPQQLSLNIVCRLPFIFQTSLTRWSWGSSHVHHCVHVRCFQGSSSFIVLSSLLRLSSPSSLYKKPRY